MKIAIAGATGTVGRHVVANARRRGHDVVRLSRSDGIDLITGDGLRPALKGVDAIIDVTNPGSLDEHAATEFFTAVAGHLQSAGAAQGVRQVVILSIVGIDAVPFGYYKAKLAHERAAHGGGVPGTVLRATQFHEFPAQQLLGVGAGRHAGVFDIQVQTVAASTVADALLDATGNPPQPRARDVAGPERASLVHLAREFAKHFRLDIDVQPDTHSVAGMPPDALLGGPDASTIGPTFKDWLDSPDADAVAERFH